MAKQIKEDGRAFDVRDIRITPACKHPEYTLHYEDKASIGPTGAWSIFRLDHPNGSWYNARWDEGESTLDIDLFHSRTATKADKGFDGHHTTNHSAPNVRSYYADIKDAHGNTVFQGTVQFSVHRRITISAKAHGAAAVLRGAFLDRDGGSSCPSVFGLPKRA